MKRQKKYGNNPKKNFLKYEFEYDGKTNNHLLKKFFFFILLLFLSTQIYITQRYSLYSFKPPTVDGEKV
jgi:hypothetical protein